MAQGILRRGADCFQTAVHLRRYGSIKNHFFRLFCTVPGDWSHDQLVSYAGEMIVGQGTPAANEVVIRIDDYLIADASIYSLDEAKAHFDIRQIYSTELGQALARAYDKRIARTLIQGARISTGDLTADLPAGLSPDDPYRTGTQVDLNKATPTADDLVASVFAAAEALDKKDVSSENRVLVATPEAYYS